MKTDRDSIRRIIHAVCEIEDVYGELAKGAGVKSNLLWTLYALDDGEYRTQKEISENWHLPKTTVNTIVKECVQYGLVELQMSSADKREYDIIMTDRGKVYAADVLREVYLAEQRALDKALETCSSSFIDDLEKFSKAFREAFHEEAYTK